jgi:hypothetical protein
MLHVAAIQPAAVARLPPSHFPEVLMRLIGSAFHCSPLCAARAGAQQTGRCIDRGAGTMSATLNTANPTRFGKGCESSDTLTDGL